jgi:PPOX class probable F420-dependent enzyme
VSPSEARARFAQARVARLASADADGAPHVVPVVFAVEGDRIVTAIDGKPKSGGMLRRLRNIGANPRVSVLADHYDEDWSRLWWARADGLARKVEIGPDADAALSLLRERYPQYATVALTGPVLVIEVNRWSGWTG